MMALASAPLPTLYEYYTSAGITNGLSANQSYFTLNNKNITLYSGAMHYFRVPKAYWRDRLRKMRAAGLNTVETYVPWNLHEPQMGSFDFGSGGSDMQDFLDVKGFIKLAQEEDLFVIVRPGPFICSEWEFGGLPSWLLKEKNIKVRTSDPVFMKYVTRYFNMLLRILALLQFTKGGPIVAFQVENEYGSTRSSTFTPDKVYLKQLRQLMINNGIVELLVTSDSPTMSGTSGTLPKYFLQTANFAGNPEGEFDRLKQLQVNKPSMAMEFWTGWFDHWSEEHHTRDNNDFYDVLERILKYPASVNMYMFTGGTNWGFLNGANLENDATDNSGYQPDTTSYDYDAPLTENGDYTEKYVMVKELIERHNVVKTKLPITPAITPRTKYQSIELKEQLLLNEIIPTLPKINSQKLLPMELLPFNNFSGQSYGYVIYRKKVDIPAGATLQIIGHICDSLTILVDGFLLNKPLTRSTDLDGFGYWRMENSSITLTSQNLTGATLDLIVENWGRNNFGHINQFNQFKGLWQGGVFLNGAELLDWAIVPLEFKQSWTNTLKKWHSPLRKWAPGPALYRGVLYVDKAEDTFVDMEKWVKGIVIVNGFVLGRFARIGPQQTLYLPGVFLKPGNNTFIVFDHFVKGRQVKFSDSHKFRTRAL